jgi:hypothetical protein
MSEFKLFTKIFQDTCTSIVKGKMSLMYYDNQTEFSARVNNLKPNLEEII